MNGVLIEWLAAWYYRACGAHERAMAGFGRVMSVRRCDHAARQFAELARRRGLFEEAEAALALHAAWRPRDARAWLALAQQRVRMGRWQAAIVALREATRLRPRDGEVWIALADAHIALQEYAFAMGPLRRAHELLPASVTVLWRIGLCQHHCGNERALRAVLEQVAAVDLQGASRLRAMTGRLDWRVTGLDTPARGGGGGQLSR